MLNCSEYVPVDDYCDCSKRCSKCGKRKKPLPDYTLIWSGL